MLVQKQSKITKSNSLAFRRVNEGEGTTLAACCKKQHTNRLNQLNDFVGKRTQAIKKKLKNDELITIEEVKMILPELLNAELINDEE